MFREFAERFDLGEDPPSVLVLDDEPSSRSLVANILRKLGIPSLATASEAEAWFRLWNGEAGLLIQDYTRLPGALGGADFLYRMRIDPELAAVPVVMITGTYRPAVEKGLAGRGLSIEEDLAGFGRKPMEIADYVDLIRRAIPRGR